MDTVTIEGWREEAREFDESMGVIFSHADRLRGTDEGIVFSVVPFGGEVEICRLCADAPVPAVPAVPFVVDGYVDGWVADELATSRVVTDKSWGKNRVVGLTLEGYLVQGAMEANARVADGAAETIV